MTRRAPTAAATPGPTRPWLEHQEQLHTTDFTV